MGGFGSGDWDRFDTKPTVESCWALDVVRMMHGRNPLLANASGTITWSDQQTSKVRATIGFSVLPAGEGLLLKLNYKANEQPVEIPVRLTTTYPHLGGERWWFTCPLIVNGVACNRRVSKLFLPPGARYFGCRKCHGLTYRSCQEAHQAERLFARIEGMERRLATLKSQQW